MPRLRPNTPRFSAESAGPRGHSTATAGVARFEEVSPTADASFGVFTYDQPTFERGWHYHPQAELTLILAGTGTRFVGDHIGSFAAGDLVLLGPNLPHSWRTSDSPAPPEANSRSVYVHFSAAAFSGPLADFPEMRGIRQVLARAARGLHFSDPVRTLVMADMTRLADLPALDRLLGFWKILDTLAQDPAAVALSSAGFAPSLDEQTSDRISRIHQHVFAHFERDISHQELARLVCLTPSALSHFFRRNTGRTLTEFINEVRVGQAARLLIDTALNVSEIAFACGFSNLSHFNATFRSLKGVNPTGYRASRSEASRDCRR